MEPPAIPTTRHSSRVSKPPIRTHEYVCSSLRSSPHYIANFITYARLSPANNDFISSISADIKPKSYHEAVLDPRWQSAMDDELHALELNNTWLIVDFPPGKIPIGNK